jgi:hypothetical protein
MAGPSDFDAGAQGMRALGPLLPLVVVGIVLVLRNRQARPLRLERLWVRPVMSVLMVALVLFQFPPPLTLTSFGLMLVGLGVGGAVGWQRGRFMKLEVHPETQAVMARMSSLGMVFVLAVIGLRIWLQSTLAQSPVAGLSAAAVTDSLMILAGAMMLVQQIEITLRARQLLAQARDFRPFDSP